MHLEQDLKNVTFNIYQERLLFIIEFSQIQRCYIYIEIKVYLQYESPGRFKL